MLVVVVQWVMGCGVAWRHWGEALRLDAGCFVPSSVGPPGPKCIPLGLSWVNCASMTTMLTVFVFARDGGGSVQCGRSCVGCRGASSGQLQNEILPLAPVGACPSPPPSLLASGCVCLCVHVYGCVHVCVFVYMCVHVCMCVCTCVWMCVRVRTCVYLCM